MNKKIIRCISENDASQILEIYKPYISDTSVTFEYNIPSLSEFKERIKNISMEYPYIVCEIDNQIIGYAYAHRLRERAAYQWNAELSIYLKDNYTRFGIGKILYGALIDLLKLQNIHNVYGVVTAPNKNSEKFHEYFGFNKLGVYHNTGYKFDSWHDVTWYEKQINEYNLNPDPFTPIVNIDREKINKITDQYTSLLNNK